MRIWDELRLFGKKMELLSAVEGNLRKMVVGQQVGGMARVSGRENLVWSWGSGYLVWESFAVVSVLARGEMQQQTKHTPIQITQHSGRQAGVTPNPCRC